MDYVIEDNAKLLDDLIKILYEDDPQCHAFEALQLAKANYEQRSMDHMLSDQYRESGGKLLSRDEILQEVDERRGTSR